MKENAVCVCGVLSSEALFSGSLQGSKPGFPITGNPEFGWLGLGAPFSVGLVGFSVTMIRLLGDLATLSVASCP